MKGQYFSFDAIIAAVIFVLALVALLSYWHSVRSFLDYQNDPLTKEAVRVSNLLFAPPAPSPNCNSMARLGLARGVDDRRVDGAVLSCASAQPAAWLKEQLGTQYDVSITVTSMADGTTIAIPEPVEGAPEPANKVNMRRLATVINTDGSTYIAAVDIALSTK